MIIQLNLFLMLIIPPIYFLIKGVVWLVKYIIHRIKCPRVKCEVIYNEEETRY